MTGDPIDAHRALQLGLVNRVVPADQVVDEAIALAERIGENSPIAVRNSRRLVREAAELTEAEGWQAHDRADDARVRERRRGRGRHRLRREAPARLAQHLTAEFGIRGPVRTLGVITPRIGTVTADGRPRAVAGGGAGPARPTSRSTRSASTRSAGCSRRPSGRAGSRWYGPEHLERLARDPRAARPGPHARAHRPHPRRRPRRHRRAARRRGRPGRRRSARGIPHARRAGRALRGAASRCSKPSPARTCSSHACTTARRATRPPTSRSCNRACGCSSRACRSPICSRSRTSTTTRPATSRRRPSGLFDRYVRAPLRASDLPDEEKAERLVEAFRALLPAVTTLVAHHFRRVLLEVAQEHLESVGEETELAAVNVAGGEPARGLAHVSRRTRHRGARSARPRRQAARRRGDVRPDRARATTRCNRLLTFRMDVGWRRDAVRSARARRQRHGCSTSRAAPATSAGPSPRPATTRSASTSRPACCAPRTPTRRSCAPTRCACRSPTRTFDGITCGFALRNFAALAPVLAECARVLAPGWTRRAARRRRAREPARAVGPRRLVPPRRAVRRRPRVRPRRVPVPARFDRVPPAAARAARPRRRRRHRRRQPARARLRGGAAHRREPARDDLRPLAAIGSAPRGAQRRDRRAGRPPRLVHARRVRVARRRPWLRRIGHRGRRCARRGTVVPRDDRPPRRRPDGVRRCAARARSGRCRSPVRATSSFPALIVGRDARGRAWRTVVDGDHCRPARGRPRFPISRAGRVPGPHDRRRTRAVARDGRRVAAGDIDRGSLEKVVLARAVRIDADRPFDLASVLAHLRRAQPGCIVYADRGFVGASPELLVRKTGATVTSRPLAGTGVDTGRARVLGEGRARAPPRRRRGRSGACACAAPTSAPTGRRRSSSPT